MTTAVPDAIYPTPDQIRDTMLRAIRYVYLRIGIDRNVLPGSDDYVRIDKLAGRVGIAIANGEISAANSDPLTAQDTSGNPALTNLAAVFGVFARPAASSAGSASIIFSGSVITIPSTPAFTGTLPDGHKITAAAGTYASGALVPITANDVGAGTNESSGTVITWDSASIGALAPTATIATGGMTGGVDADDQETLRQRLLRRLAAAAVGGNWSSIVGWAEASTASVDTAYCYAACQGPASYDVAVLAAGGNRTLAASIVAAVKAYILGQMPGEEQITVTTVTPYPMDISLAAQLPLPQSAGGPGGGWRDPIPWPQGQDVQVTAYSSGIATLSALSGAPPVVGNSIGIWDPSYVDPVTGAVGLMREYTISSAVEVFGFYLIQVQNGFAVSPLGAYLSAGAVSLVQYARTFADQIAVLGPGEKTSLPELLPRSLRQPQAAYPNPISSLTTKLWDTLQTSYPEIANLAWGVTYQEATTNTVTSPPVPTSTNRPPNVLTLANFALRRQ